MYKTILYLYLSGADDNQAKITDIWGVGEWDGKADCRWGILCGDVRGECWGGCFGGCLNIVSLFDINNKCFYSFISSIF